MDSIFSRLRTERKRIGASQQTLAVLLDVSRRTQCSYESDASDLTSAKPESNRHALTSGGF
ncbi:hypothetical protein C8K63_106141 [Pseudomonas sp. GV085]|nr:hypothetical protein C8K63_106141 [Pseudomonas sp. GV085]